MKLSRIDLQVLDIVSKDARITIKDMAEEVKASRSSVNQHLMSLIASGAVTSPGYQINPKFLGYNTCTYVGIRFEKGCVLKDVIEEIKLIDEVVECHITTGSYSLFIKLYAKDNTNLLHILSERIQVIPGVAATETLISLEMAFDRNIRIEHLPQKTKR